MIIGAIFNLDGVLADSQLLHSKVESEVLRKMGVALSPNEITEKYSETRARILFHEMLEKNDIVCDLNELINEKWEMMSELAKDSISPVEGSMELIERFHKGGIKLAVVTSSNAKYVKTALEKLKMRKYFETAISGEMVERLKPDPECLLMAARLIEMRSEQIVVVDNRISGMEAAKAAGMKCIGFVQNRHQDYPTKNLVSKLEEITTEYLCGLD